jgi:hypothetical protein
MTPFPFPGMPGMAGPELIVLVISEPTATELPPAGEVDATWPCRTSDDVGWGCGTFADPVGPASSDARSGVRALPPPVVLDGQDDEREQGQGAQRR